MFAYGIAVAGDMLITSLLVAIVAHGVWKWPGFIVIVVAGLFLILDATFVLVRRYPLRLQLAAVATCQCASARPSGQPSSSQI